MAAADTSRQRSDALVFFGATGDLAYKKIFPALQSIARRGKMDFPVIGVARGGFTRDKLIERAKASCAEYGGLHEEGFKILVEHMHYIDGEYGEESTFSKLRGELGDAKRPAHYLAIPPSMFPTVVTNLKRSGCAEGGRVIVEKHAEKK